MVTWFDLLFVQFVCLYVFKSVLISARFNLVLTKLLVTACGLINSSVQMALALCSALKCVELKRSPCQLAAPSTFTLKSYPSEFRTFSNQFRKLQLISKPDRWCSSYHSCYTLFSELVQAASLSIVMLTQYFLMFGTPSHSHPCPQLLTHLPKPPQRSRRSIKHIQVRHSV